MQPTDFEKMQLLPEQELTLRLDKIRDSMRNIGADAILLSDNANIYYLTGRVFCGFIFLPLEGSPTYAVRRPCHLTGNGILPIRKVEDIPANIRLTTGTIALEMGVSSYSDICRIQNAFGNAYKYINATPIMSAARAVKTAYELDKIRTSGIKQTRLYERIPHIYQPGMRDIDLQIEIERTARLEGCLGQFRISGTDMELFMGSILVGNNADSPSPYDFAMGGAGMDPSLPVGANGTLIRPGESVMVDVNGNFTGYMTDMTRCFAVNRDLPSKAIEAHNLSIKICSELAMMGRPGIAAKDLFNRAAEMAREAGFEHEFMGHRQHAGFVGHGVGIEINELPVLAPKSKSVLEVGNVIAIEPKFVIPEVGAVGIENTYAVKQEGPMECLTNAPQQIIYFD